MQIDLRGRASRRERGSVLFVAVAILGLLSVMVIAFIAHTQLEQSASRNYVDEQRAKLTAKAGLNRAIAEIERIALQKPFDDNSPNATNGTDEDPLGRDSWIFGDAPGTRVSEAQLLSFDGGPLVLEPSSPSAPANRNVTVSIPGGGTTTPRHKSGTIAGTYVEGGDVYSLKIFDTASQINVNMASAVNLERILTTLSSQQAEVGMSAALAADVSDSIVGRRPVAGYENKRQVIEAIRAVNGVTADQTRALRDMVTTIAFRDLTTIRPPLAIPATNELLLEERSPVNLNTANKAVLTAVLSGIQAVARDGTTVTIDVVTARAIAEAIEVRRGDEPFQSWADFGAFLDGQSATVDDATSTVTFAADGTVQAQLQRSLSALEQALIMANANPNTDLNKWHPDPNFDSPIDKSDLLVYSTEFCFSSMGFFEIQSLGSVFRLEGEDEAIVTAESLLTSVVRVFKVFRDTTQRDFERGRLVDLSDGVIRAADLYAWMGVLSGPEYSNNRDPQSSNLDLATGYQPADYDGQLFLNGLIRVRVLTDPSVNPPVYQDYTMGGARGSLVADTATGVPIGTFPSADPANAPAVAQLQNPNPPELVNVDGVNRLVNPRLVGALPAGLANEKEFLFGGAELLPIGVEVDGGYGPDLGDITPSAARRNAFDRFVEIHEDNMPLAFGTIDFWVKPTFDFDLSGDLDEVYFHWGGQVDSRESCIQIRRERNGAVDQIVAYFSVGEFGGSGTLGSRRLIVPLGARVPAWNVNEWHHVRVTFGKRNVNGVGVADAGIFVDGRPGAGNGQPFQTKRLIITATSQAFFPISFDDIFATNPPGRRVGTSPVLTANSIVANANNTATVEESGGTGTFPEINLPPSATVQVIDQVALSQHAEVIDTNNGDGTVTLVDHSNGPIRVGRNDSGNDRASAIFDNILLQHFRNDQDPPPALTSFLNTGFPPNDRYHDSTAAAVAQNGALFRKAVALFTGTPVRLGSLSFTQIAAFPDEAAGNNRGDLNIGFEVTGPTQNIKAPAGTANSDGFFSDDGRPMTLRERVRGWIPLGGRRIDGLDRVAYSVDLSPPALGDKTFAGITVKQSLTQSPILDDVTVMFFSRPSFILTEEGGEE